MREVRSAPDASARGIFYSGSALEATAEPHAHTRRKILNFFMLEQRVRLDPRRTQTPEEKNFFILE
jgi:hypothetical protein